MVDIRIGIGRSALGRQWLALQVGLLAFVCLTCFYLLAKTHDGEAGYLRDRAVQVAQRWADTLYMQRNLFGDLFERDGTDLTGELMLRSLAQLSEIRSFALYDPDGVLAVTSEPSLQSADTLLGVTPKARAEALGGTPTVEIQKNTPSGTMPAVWARTIVPVRDRAGTVRGAAAFAIDLTEKAALLARHWQDKAIFALILGAAAMGNALIASWLLFAQRRSGERIRHMALHDPLTGVANRTRFQHELNAALSGLRERDSRVALHMIDLDGFKGINDALGHDAGDNLLRKVALLLEDTVRSGDVVARLGGDEFAILQMDVVEPPQATALGERMLKRVRAVREIDGVPVSISFSVGVAIAPEHAGDATELQKAADAAVYRAKANGRDQVVLFESGMDADLKMRNSLRVLIREALETDGFRLHYQPIHDATSARLLGFEALLRLDDQAGKPIPPGTFIPVAEEMGLTPRIGRWVLNEATRQAAQWPHELSVSINLSVQQFQEDLVALVSSALDQSGLAAERLELEITESLFIADPNEVERQLLALKALGVNVVMDDFGTGYSSLSTLWKFPFDKLKVDRSCFTSVEHSERVGQVLRTITAMSGAMNLRVVAEGIETEGQREFAQQSGYDELQGFLCGRPMPSANLADYIAASRSAPQAPFAHCESSRGNARQSVGGATVTLN